MRNEELIEKPYQSVCSYFEEMLPKVGGHVARYLSLMPISMITPQFRYKDRPIRSSLNVITITPSGGGKSTLVNAFRKIAYLPYSFDNITTARLENDVAQSGICTIVINDLSRVLGKMDTVKVLESVLEEGEIIKKTMNSEHNTQNIRACMFGVGVASDISNYISSGFLFRVVPIVVMHDFEAQRDIGRDITENIERELNNPISMANIEGFYKALRTIQAGKSENNPPVSRFEIPNEFRNKIYSSWANCLDRLQIDETTLWFRELLDGFRFLNSMALMNYLDREKEHTGKTCVLYPSKEDLEIGVKLMCEEIVQKYKITKMYEMRKKLGKLKDLKTETIK